MMRQNKKGDLFSNFSSATVLFTAVVLLLFMSTAGTAKAYDLNEEVCRCCHTEYLADRHHLLVDNVTYVCLTCHDLVYNPVTMMYDPPIVFRDCIICHSSSLADQHHLTDEVADCFNCHTMRWNPVSYTYDMGFVNECDLIATESSSVDNYALHEVAYNDCLDCHDTNLADLHNQACTFCHDSNDQNVIDAVDVGNTACTACHPATIHTPPSGPEICEDDIDNDGDGLVDCLDSDCQRQRVCKTSHN